MSKKNPLLITSSDRYFKKPLPASFDDTKSGKNKGAYNNKNYNNQSSNHRAVVKIMGGAKNYNNLCRNIDYITRNGKLELTTQYKEILLNKERELAKQEFLQLNTELSRNNQYKQTYNLAFSLSSKLAKEYNNDKKLHAKLKQSVEATIDKLYPNNYYAYVLHTDTNNPHVHVILAKKDVVKNKNINLNKKSIREIKHDFSKQLIDRGVEVKLELERAQFKKRLNHYTTKSLAPNVYKLISHGIDHYKHDKSKDMSYFVEYATKTGRPVKIWGVNLERELIRSKAEIGQYIKIKKTQKEIVYKERHINHWEIAVHHEQNRVLNIVKDIKKGIEKSKEKIQDKDKGKDKGMDMELTRF